MIEDNEGLRATMVDILEETEDLTCPVSTSSMERALAILDTQECAPPEVIVVDLGLPGMSGLEGILKLRQHLPECEILVFTVFEDHEKICAAIRNGASGYLLKTEPMDRIPHAIREARTGGAPMSPPVARMALEHLRSSPIPQQHDYSLSRREIEVLTLMTRGLVKKEIAHDLQLSYHTIDSYVRGIYKKLHVNTIQGAVGKALEERILHHNRKTSKGA